MKFYSTNGKSGLVDFETALMRGLAEDGGLYMPEVLGNFQFSISNFQTLPELALAKNQRSNIKYQSLGLVAQQVLGQFVDIPRAVLRKICVEAFNFSAPLVQLDENLYILELFHGPTLSFKDFGAQFMARVMDHVLKIKNQKSKIKNKLNIIVATSGDTGSAVAQGFYGMENIRVFVLYPKGRVSKFQEQQMATLGKNIVALEVRGDFDDCQRIAKLALADKTLGINVSSANSINIGRLLPQMVYYFWAGAQIAKRKSQSAYGNLLQLQKSEVELPTFVVPSGNFGNLTAGLFAKKLGLPCGKFVAAVNKNSIVPEYLESGGFVPRKTEMTYSSAMDVGLPSNMARIGDLYKGLRNTKKVGIYEKMKKDLEAVTVSEAETKKTIADIYKKYGYVADPHTAVGIAAVLKYHSSPSLATRGASLRLGTNRPDIVLATAHPAKFPEIVESAIGHKVELPKTLRLAQDKKKQSVVIGADYEELKRVLATSG